MTQFSWAKPTDVYTNVQFTHNGTKKSVDKESRSALSIFGGNTINEYHIDHFIAVRRRGLYFDLRTQYNPTLFHYTNKIENVRINFTYCRELANAYAMRYSNRSFKSRSDLVEMYKKIDSHINSVLNSKDVPLVYKSKVAARFMVLDILLSDKTVASF